MPVTAKVKCTNKVVQTEGNVSVNFTANYADDEGNPINREWAYATPHCGVSMTLNPEAGALFEQGKTYTLTFDEDTPDGTVD